MEDVDMTRTRAQVCFDSCSSLDDDHDYDYRQPSVRRLFFVESTKSIRSQFFLHYFYNYHLQRSSVFKRFSSSVSHSS